MKTISFHVTNLSAKDAQFLSTLIALFTDPRNDEQAALIRDGKQQIQYSPIDGRALLVDADGPGAAQILDKSQITNGQLPITNSRPLGGRLGLRYSR